LEGWLEQRDGVTWMWYPVADNLRKPVAESMRMLGKLMFSRVTLLLR
jgi:hypothetical protein